MESTVAPLSGVYGFDHVTGTAAQTGRWFAIKAIGGSATGSFTMSAGDSLTAFTIPENDILYGPCTAFTLSSGAVLAYLY